MAVYKSIDPKLEPANQYIKNTFFKRWLFEFLFDAENADYLHSVNGRRALNRDPGFNHSVFAFAGLLKQPSLVRTGGLPQ